jgi:Flp pilus assembly pilin Flp
LTPEKKTGTLRRNFQALRLHHLHSSGKHEPGLLRRLLLRLLRETAGENLTEYALLLLLVALGAIAGIQQLACQVNCSFEVAGKVVAKAMGKVPPGQLVSCSKKC